METELQAIRDVVNGSSLSTETRQSLLHGFDQLLPLYRDLDRTYDVRYRDAIARLVEGMLHRLGKEDETSTESGKLGAEILSSLSAMHQRLGIPSLGVRPPAPAKRSRKPRA